MKQARKTYYDHLDNLGDVEDTLNVLEEKSKYFRVGELPVPPLSSTKERKDRRWLDKTDLEHADEINKIGHGKSTRNFNHDKYAQPSETHNYRFCGDILKPGNDFTNKIERHKYIPAPVHQRKKYKYKLEPFLQETEDGVKLPVSLPPNIKHQFGTKVCNHLLVDKKVVDDTVENQRQNYDRILKRRLKDDPIPPIETVPETMYDKLGNTLRTDLFPGYSLDHNTSLAHTSYTNEVHKNRPEIPDQYRFQSDDLSEYFRYFVIVILLDLTLFNGIYLS